MKAVKILAFAARGSGTRNEERLRSLLSGHDAEIIPFDRGHKISGFISILHAVRKNRPALVFVEGTGIGGGLALIAAKVVWRIPYVVSSGDAVGPFIAAQFPSLGSAGALYERFLCRFSAGFIGWTPYLCGRALTFGAPRAMTAAGWADFPRTPERLKTARDEIRRKYAIPQEALVVGIVGALNWTERYRYCYGLELVEALGLAEQPRLHALIVGDGDGRIHLEEAATRLRCRNIHLVGNVSREQVPDYLAAMDIGSLPQSVDRVGSFRYTAKISEYLDVGLPVVTGQIPLAYDLPGDWFWRLSGDNPWDKRYIRALSELLTDVSPEEIAAKKAATREALPCFDKNRQIQRVTEFLSDIIMNSAKE